jgi:hypothetical protein
MENKLDINDKYKKYLKRLFVYGFLAIIVNFILLLSIINHKKTVFIQTFVNDTIKAKSIKLENNIQLKLVSENNAHCYTIPTFNLKAKTICSLNDPSFIIPLGLKKHINIIDSKEITFELLTDLMDKDFKSIMSRKKTILFKINNSTFNENFLKQFLKIDSLDNSFKEFLSNINIKVELTHNFFSKKNNLSDVKLKVLIDSKLFTYNQEIKAIVGGKNPFKEKQFKTLIFTKNKNKSKKMYYSLYKTFFKSYNDKIYINQIFLNKNSPVLFKENEFNSLVKEKLKNSILNKQKEYNYLYIFETFMYELFVKDKYGYYVEVNNKKNNKNSLKVNRLNAKGEECSSLKECKSKVFF